jgi:hypothetical protein
MGVHDHPETGLDQVATLIPAMGERSIFSSKVLFMPSNGQPASSAELEPDEIPRPRVMSRTDESRDSSTSDRQLLRVAELYYEHDMTQEEIARQLTLTRWKVARMLRSARDRGIVRIEIVHPKARVHELEARLMTRFGLQQAFVVPASGDADHQRREVALVAADAVRPAAGTPRRRGALGPHHG